MSSVKLTKPTVPFAEGSWQSGMPSPYFNKPSHLALREYVRQWTEDNLIPFSEKWDDDGAPDPELYQKFAKEGMLIPFALGVSIPEKFYKMAGGIKLPGNVDPKEWDNFHDFILIDELYRCGSNGAVMSSYGGLAYGAGPIVHFAGQELQNCLLPDLLQGKKRICLAITEPNAGSNVSNVQTTATKSADGKHYIVSGQKKWITNGIWADFFTTLVRTSGKPGDPKGLSLLVIPRTKDLTTRKMKMQGAHASGTTFVEFDDVKVPVENLIGKEGEGFRYVMYNFNHERMTIVYVALRMARVSIEDAVAHARRREVFGQKLIEQPVVRHKIANMARETEALQAWTEALIYQQSKLSIAESNRLTGGQTGLLKAHAGIVLEKVNREALQLLGGMGLTRGGTGERIERIWREVKGLTIPGGAEDVLLDLGVRQQLKLVSPQTAKL